MSDTVGPVKRGAARLREIAAKNKTHAVSIELVEIAEAMDAMVIHTQGLEQLTTAVSLSFGDLSDIPDELKAELNVPKPDELDNQIATLINTSAGRTATIDQILIGLWRKFGVVQKRRFLQGRLYRMIKNDMLWSVPDRKGTYTTVPTEGGSSMEDFQDDEPPERPDPPRRRPMMEDNPFDRSGDFDDEIPF